MSRRAPCRARKRVEAKEALVRLKGSSTAIRFRRLGLEATIPRLKLSSTNPLLSGLDKAKVDRITLSILLLDPVHMSSRTKNQEKAQESLKLADGQ